MHLLGLVSYGGVHSHLASLARAARARTARVWPTGPGFTRSPTGATCRRTPQCDDLAELPAERVATVCGRYYAMDRDQRWERTDRAFGAIRRGEGRRGRRSRRGCPCELRARRDRRVHRARRARRADPGSARATPPIFFNFRPDRARQLSQRLLEAGIDLTTMTRYREDFPFPVAFDEQKRAEHARRSPRHARAPAAPRRRDREVRPRDVLLQRRRGAGVGGGDADPRPVAARRPELRPEARDVRGGGRAARLRRDRRRLRVLRRELRESGHGRAHRLDSRGSRGGRGDRSRARARPRVHAGGSEVCVW